MPSPSVPPPSLSGLNSVTHPAVCKAAFDVNPRQGQKLHMSKPKAEAGYCSEVLPAIRKDAGARSRSPLGIPTPTAIHGHTGKTFTPSKEFLSEAHRKIDALYFPLANSNYGGKMFNIKTSDKAPPGCIFLHQRSSSWQQAHSSDKKSF